MKTATIPPPDWSALASSYRENPNLTGESVWKDECLVSFGSPSGEEGLFLNLRTLQGWSRRYALELDVPRSSAPTLYLHIVWTPKPMPPPFSSTAPPLVEPPKKLAIGVEGGFSPVKTSTTEFEKRYTLVVSTNLDQPIAEYFPDSPAETEKAIPLPNLRNLLDSIVKRKSDASREAEVVAWEASSDLIISKYAEDLPQLPTGGKRLSMDPKTWKCEDCGVTENLWLNLSTGYIGSGRANWDGTGGTGAALRHFESTGGKYPLVVKLGTITPEGKADVYSYAPDEDRMVIDPKLREHLAHWGLKMEDAVKTERTIAEMEVDLNVSYDWMRIVDAGGKAVEPVSGPNRVGLVNLGNSCYCNSIYQALFCLAPFSSRFTHEGMMRAVKTPPPGVTSPAKDVFVQLCKLNCAMRDPERFVRGAFYKEDPGDYVTPRMLKTLAGEGHPDFSTGEQQDAAEYYRHLLDRLTRYVRRGNSPLEESTLEMFRFFGEERLECLQSNQVRYTHPLLDVLELAVPGGEVGLGLDEKGRRVFDVRSCLELTLGAGASETVEDYLSPVTKQRGVALKASRIKTLPRVLVVQLKRFVVAEGGDWRAPPTKLDCTLRADRPEDEVLDLTPYLSIAVPREEREGEVLMTTSSDGESEGNEDVEVVEAIVGMGFSRAAAKKAVKATRTNNNNNSKVELAMNWVMEHMDDPNLNVEESSTTTTSTTSGADPASVEMLMAMGGFEKGACEFALGKCQGNVERAADWLFSRDAGEIAREMASARAEAGSGGVGGDQKRSRGGGGEQEEEGGGVSASTLQQRQEEELQRRLTARGGRLEGLGRYRLRAVVSHIGKTSHSGHYVCHVKSRETGEWIFFNDDKVAKQDKPTLDQGYVLFYEREEE